MILPYFALKTPVRFTKLTTIVKGCVTRIIASRNHLQRGQGFGIVTYNLTDFEPSRCKIKLKIFPLDQNNFLVK